MDRAGEMHETPGPATTLGGQSFIGLLVLFACFILGIIDSKVVLVGLIIRCICSGRVANFFGPPTQIAVVTGKYIFKDVTAHTDGPEDVRPLPAPVVEQSSNEPLVLGPWPRFEPLGQSSDRSKVLEGVESPKKQSVTVHRFGWVVSGRLSTNTASAVEKDEDELSPQTPQLEAALSPKRRLGKHEVRSKRGDRPSRVSASVHAIASFMRNRATAQKPKVQRVVGDRVAKLRFQRGRKSHVARVLTGRHQHMAKEAMVDNIAEADGLMVGLEVDDSMVGLEFPEVEEPMDLRADGPDALVEALANLSIDGMEVDEESPDPVNDLVEAMAGWSIDGMEVDGDF